MEQIEKYIKMEQENEELRKKFVLYQNGFINYLINHDSYSIESYLEEYPQTLMEGLKMLDLIDSYRGRDLFKLCLNCGIPYEDIPYLLETAFHRHPIAKTIIQKTKQKEEEQEYNDDNNEN